VTLLIVVISILVLPRAVKWWNTRSAAA
jgi:hypothetical protein